MDLNPSFWKLLYHLPKFIRLVLRLLKDGRVPLSGKVVFFLGVAYVAWPLDLIPDFVIPFAGSFDDVALLLVCLRYLLYRTPPAVLAQHLTALGERPAKV